MHITDVERQQLINLVAALPELAQNERQQRELRAQQHAVKSRVDGHADAYQDAARRLEAIIGDANQQAAKDTPLLETGTSNKDE